jgi:hypothetical protein
VPIEQQQALDQVFPGEVTLLHGRFSAADRADKTEAVLDQLGPNTAERAHRLVVVATQLSAAEDSARRNVAVGINELRGVYLAQSRLNRFDPPVQLRVVFANFGQDSAHAESTEGQIRRLREVRSARDRRAVVNL